MYVLIGIQNLLRDDSSLYGLTPRSVIAQGQLRTDQGFLLKEGTNTSIQSQRLPMGQQLSPRTQGPMQVSRNKKSNLYYTRGITPNRVTSGGSIYAACVKGNTTPQKRGSGGELLAALRPGRESKPNEPMVTILSQK